MAEIALREAKSILQPYPRKPWLYYRHEDSFQAGSNLLFLLPHNRGVSKMESLGAATTRDTV